RLGPQVQALPRRPPARPGVVREAWPRPEDGPRPRSGRVTGAVRRRRRRATLVRHAWPATSPRVPAGFDDEPALPARADDEPGRAGRGRRRGRASRLARDELGSIT